MISGAGMLDFLACQSAEKLVVDAEAIEMAKRLVAGVQERTQTLALEMFAGIDFKADFLKQKLTRQLFSAEQHLPLLRDRPGDRRRAHGRRLDGPTRWRARPGADGGDPAGLPPPTRRRPNRKSELRHRVEAQAKAAGMDVLPSIGAEAQG